MSDKDINKMEKLSHEREINHNDALILLQQEEEQKNLIGNNSLGRASNKEISENDTKCRNGNYHRVIPPDGGFQVAFITNFCHIQNEHILDIAVTTENP